MGLGERRAVEDLHPVERQACELAIGRIFRMGSRPTQAGDVEEYERCREIVLTIMDGDYGSQQYRDWLEGIVKA